MKIDTRDFDNLIKEMEKIPAQAVQEAGVYFKNVTPVRTGNARNRTKTNIGAKAIEANYGYAGRLDEGYSRQAPQGMSDPTIARLDKIVDEMVRRL